MRIVEGLKKAKEERVKINPRHSRIRKLVVIFVDAAAGPMDMSSAHGYHGYLFSQRALITIVPPLLLSKESSLQTDSGRYNAPSALNVDPALIAHD
jgi:hypothetical protein